MIFVIWNKWTDRRINISQPFLREWDTFGHRSYHIQSIHLAYTGRLTNGWENIHPIYEFIIPMFDVISRNSQLLDNVKVSLSVCVVKWKSNIYLVKLLKLILLLLSAISSFCLSNDAMVCTFNGSIHINCIAHMYIYWVQQSIALTKCCRSNH